MFLVLTGFCYRHIYISLMSQDDDVTTHICCFTTLNLPVCLHTIDG